MLADQLLRVLLPVAAELDARGDRERLRELYVASAMARGFEQAAHTIARCAVIVRDYVLNTSSITKSA